jgi:phage-related protein
VACHLRPYADLIEDDIHELRIRVSGDQVRILYFFCFKDFIILTNAFAKRSARVPRSAIEEVKRHRKDFLDRVTEKDLREMVK